MAALQDMFSEKIIPLFNKYGKVKLDLSTAGLDRLSRSVTTGFAVIALAYVVAVFVTTMIMNTMVSSIISTRQRAKSQNITAADVSLQFVGAPNYRDITRRIIERNLFNVDGTLPDEKNNKEGKRSGAGFDINAPCQKTTLNIELVGTIYLGDPIRSFATVREKGYGEADIYRVGEAIVGNENATIAAIERQKLIINNGGTKECIDLMPATEKAGGDGFPTIPGEGGASVSGGEVTLEGSYVEGELGPGFGKIVDAARLVPNVVDNQMTGFKIFAIKPDSLFSRVGFQNGDVITQVNDISLKLPEQGFALYQALQDEKEVRIQLLRNGTTPTTLNVRIK